MLQKYTTHYAGFFVAVLSCLIMPAAAHATAAYSAAVSVSVNAWYDTNSAGLTDYRRMHVSATFSSTPSGSEGIYGGTLTLHVGPYTLAPSIPGTPNPYNCTVTVSDFFTVDPSNSSWDIYATAVFNFWNQGGGNAGDGTYTKSSDTIHPGPGTNTLGNATFTFTNTSFVYDGTPKSPTVTVVPANAGVSTSGDTTRTMVDNYSIAATVTNPDYQGSGSTAWSITKANQPPIGANSASVPYSGSFYPSYTGGAGNGTWQFCVATVSDWGTTTISAATNGAWRQGTWDIWVWHLGDNNYNDAGPTQSGSLTISAAPAAPTGSLTASPSSINLNGYSTSTLTGLYTLGAGESLLRVCINQSFNNGPQSTVTEGPTYVFLPGQSGSYTFTLYVASTSYVNPVAVASATVTVNAQTPATFTFAPLSFVYDGASHQPGVTPNPSNATYTVGGSGAQTNIGNSYTISAVATGAFSGSGSANWAITAPLAPAALSISGSTTDFGSAYRDTLAGTPTSTVRTFTLTNTGDLSLTISAVTTTGNFAVTGGPALPCTLNGGGTVSVTITFTPGASVGTNNGTLTITTTANSPSLALTGVGLAPKIGVSWH